MAGHGGKRAGAGRPKGSKGHRRLPAALARSAAAERRLSPLDRLLDRIEDESEPIRYRDALCIAVLPYLHAKPAANMTAKASFEMTDEELAAVIAREEAYQRGELAGHIIQFPGRRR